MDPNNTQSPRTETETHPLKALWSAAARGAHTRWISARSWVSSPWRATQHTPSSPESQEEAPVSQDSATPRSSTHSTEDPEPPQGGYFSRIWRASAQSPSNSHQPARSEEAMTISLRSNPNPHTHTHTNSPAPTGNSLAMNAATTQAPPFASSPLSCTVEQGNPHLEKPIDLIEKMKKRLEKDFLFTIEGSDKRGDYLSDDSLHTWNDGATGPGAASSVSEISVPGVIITGSYSYSSLTLTFNPKSCIGAGRGNDEDVGDEFTSEDHRTPLHQLMESLSEQTPPRDDKAYHEEVEEYTQKKSAWDAHAQEIANYEAKLAKYTPDLEAYQQYIQLKGEYDSQAPAARGQEPAVVQNPGAKPTNPEDKYNDTTSPAPINPGDEEPPYLAQKHNVHAQRSLIRATIAQFGPYTKDDPDNPGSPITVPQTPKFSLNKVCDSLEDLAEVLAAIKMIRDNAPADLRDKIVFNLHGVNFTPQCQEAMKDIISPVPPVATKPGAPAPAPMTLLEAFKAQEASIKGKRPDLAKDITTLLSCQGPLQLQIQENSQQRVRSPSTSV